MIAVLDSGVVSCKMSHNQFRSEGHRVLAYMEEHDGTIDVRVSSADCMEKLGLTIEGLEFGLNILGLF